MAAVAGVSRYKTALDVWAEKTGRMAPQEAGEAAYWGTQLEPLVAAWFAEQTGAQVRRRSRLVVDKARPYLIGNVDREVTMPDGRRGILEVKCSGRASEWADGGVPDAAAIQLQHYLGVSGRAWGWVAVLLRGNEGRIVEAPRDEALIASLRGLAAEFWPYVERDECPPAERWGGSARAAASLYPEATADEVELPALAEDLIRQYEEARAASDAAAEAKDQAATALKLLLREHGAGRLGERVVRWATVRRREFDSAAFKAAHPDTYAAFTKELTLRRFSIH
jgi:putative phage-type endonuclease